MRKVLIYVDTREVSSNVIEHFKQYDCDIEKKMLLYGDFMVSDRVCIERKTAQDFLSSIIDKRLFLQLKDMKENYDKPILLIEGNDLYGRLHPNVVRGALAAIALDFKVPVIWTRDVAETAGIIYWIARREQFQENRTISYIEKKKASSIKEQQELIVHGLPGVSIIRARSLLKHFKTPEKIFNATEKELADAKNIGKVTAKKIKKVLTSKYE
ncbi:MAG: ERCC4 domain-containing protein [Candidatus Aenigmarchaeota archaeon]|nr:ERCC4 domain-containing protein [Candidatus Aenigmarchaeota archaeon]